MPGLKIILFSCLILLCSRESYGQFPGGSKDISTNTRSGNEKSESRTVLIQSLLDNALQQYNLGSFEQSIQNYLQALEHCHKEDGRLAFQAYSGIAKCYTIQGDYDEAAQHFYQAITTAENVTGIPVKLANTFTNLSVIWNLLGDEQQSLSYLDKAANYAVKENDSMALGNIMNKRGNIYLNIDTGKAQELYRTALHISRSCHDHSTATMATANLAYIHILKGNEDSARIMLAQFYPMFQNKNLDRFHRLSLYYTYGLYLFLLKDYAVAEKVWLDAITLAEAAHASLYTVKPMQGLSLLYAATHQYDKAYHFQQLHDALNSSIVNEAKLKAVNILENKYRLAQKEKMLALNQLKMAEQKAALLKQNILIVAGVAVSMLMVILYLFIRKNSKRKLILEQKKNQLHSRQKELEQIKTVMDGEEKERRRVALELHDGIGSMLSMAKLNLSMVRDHYLLQPDDYHFDDVLQLIDRSSQAVRSTAHNLMPEILLQGGLDEGLHLYCSKLAKARNIVIDYQHYGHPGPMEISKEKMLFRILQEVMRVIIDCSDAQRLLLQLNWQEDLLYVTLQTYDSSWDIDHKDQSLQEAWNLLQQRIIASEGMLYLDNIGNINPTFDLEFQI
jgi:signal transduction histidine kinase